MTITPNHTCPHTREDTHVQIRWLLITSLSPNAQCSDHGPDPLHTSNNLSHIPREDQLACNHIMKAGSEHNANVCSCLRATQILPGLLASWRRSWIRLCSRSAATSTSGVNAISCTDAKAAAYSSNELVGCSLHSFNSRPTMPSGDKTRWAAR